MRMVRIACWIWAAAIMLIMWLPRPRFAGIDLTSEVVQGAAFVVGAVLFALADDQRRAFLRRRGGQSPVAYVVLRFKRHLARVSLLLAGYAAILEIGQLFAAGRQFHISRLFENIGWVLVTSLVVYALARLLFANPYLGRITRRHLRQVAAAFRAESLYAAALRDRIQAGYAVCVSRSLAAEDKVEQIRRLLDEALGLELPKPGEVSLDAAFGRRRGPEKASVEDKPAAAAAAAAPQR
ncbi:MAG TPA: hypothetical protein VFQ82_12455 [Stellaceae bacterium]|nr:hypothetical protein [Stellaceae bacterium]